MSFDPEMMQPIKIGKKYWHKEWCAAAHYEFGIDFSFERAEVGIYFLKWYISFNWRGEQ